MRSVHHDKLFSKFSTFALPILLSRLASVEPLCVGKERLIEHKYISRSQVYKNEAFYTWSPGVNEVLKFKKNNSASTENKDSP